MLGKGLSSLIPPSSQKPGASLPPPEERQEIAAPAPIRDLPVPDPVPQAEPSRIPEPIPQKPASHGEPARSFAAYPTHKMPDAIFHIEVDKIKSNPDQPRRVFDEGAIKELASSIREFGILQPIVVTKVEHEVPTGTEVEYILISGERRLMASKSLGLERIPAIIRAVGADRERLELAVIENIQRENLNVIEVARAMSRLQDEFRLTQREIATRLGKSREAVANTVRLLDLPPKMQEALGRGEISESHGRLLLAVDDAAVQQRLFDDLTTKSLTTRELKARVDQNRTRQTRGMRMHPTPPPAWMDVESRLSASLGAPVKISGSGESGTITIAFYSDEELSQIVEKIKKDAADQMIL